MQHVDTFHYHYRSGPACYISVNALLAVIYKRCMHSVVLFMNYLCFLFFDKCILFFHGSLMHCVVEYLRVVVEKHTGRTGTRRPYMNMAVN